MSLESDNRLFATMADKKAAPRKEFVLTSTGELVPKGSPWGMQTSQQTGQIQRAGVRHLHPNDPLRKAAMVGQSGRRQGQPKMLTTACHECGFEKSVDRHYSKSQIKKNTMARCNECVGGLPHQCDPIVEAEKASIEKPPRGLEGRLCWGCSAVATGHEVYCQTCKAVPVWFCTPQCKTAHVRLHMMWHIRKMEDNSFELSIGEKPDEEEVSRVLEEWKYKVKRDEWGPPPDNASADASADTSAPNETQPSRESTTDSAGVVS
jgi:hypothetical protein